MHPPTTTFPTQHPPTSSTLPAFQSALDCKMWWGRQAGGNMGAECWGGMLLSGKYVLIKKKTSVVSVLEGFLLGDMGAGWMAEQADYRAVSQCWLVGRKCQRVLSLTDGIFRGHLFTGQHPIWEELQETQWPFSHSAFSLNIFQIVWAECGRNSAAQSVWPPSWRESLIDSFRPTLVMSLACSCCSECILKHLRVTFCL